MISAVTIPTLIQGTRMTGSTGRRLLNLIIHKALALN